MKKIKLTQEQKDRIMLMYAAMRYFETLEKRGKEEVEEKFVEDIEEIINLPRQK